MRNFILYRARHVMAAVITLLSTHLAIGANSVVAAPLQQTSYEPTTVGFEGYLKNTSGAPFNEPHTLTFRLYSALTGGTPVWGETQGDVPFSNGLYSVQLGSGSLLPGMTALSPFTFS